MGTTLAHNLNNFIQQHGVWGLGLHVSESIGIPFASAVVALTAGSLISSGQASFLQVLLITTAGLTLGSQSVILLATEAVRLDASCLSRGKKVGGKTAIWSIIGGGESWQFYLRSCLVPHVLGPQFRRGLCACSSENLLSIQRLAA